MFIYPFRHMQITDPCLSIEYSHTVLAIHMLSIIGCPSKCNWCTKCHAKLIGCNCWACFQTRLIVSRVNVSQNISAYSCKCRTWLTVCATSMCHLISVIFVWNKLVDETSKIQNLDLQFLCSKQLYSGVVNQLDFVYVCILTD